MPENIEEAFEQALAFFACKKPVTGKAPPERLLDYERDWLTIWADFLTYNKINLNVVDLHWWEFCALLDSLPAQAAIKQIMSIRATDLSKIKDPELRREYREKKEYYRLDREEDDIDAFYQELNGAEIEA